MRVYGGGEIAREKNVCAERTKEKRKVREKKLGHGYKGRCGNIALLCGFDQTSRENEK